MELLTKLGINWQLLLAQIVNFLIVVGVLTYLVYRPLLNLLDKRSERIKKSLDDVKRIEEERKKIEQYRAEQMRKIDEESGMIMAETKKKAEVMHKDLLARAHADAERLLEQGRQQLTAERADALREMQASVGRVIISLTEKLLEREFSPADQKKMLESLNESIPTALT